MHIPYISQHLLTQVWTHQHQHLAVSQCLQLCKPRHDPDLFTTLCRYLLSCSPELAAKTENLLRITPSQVNSAELLEMACTAIHTHWPQHGQQRRLALFNHMDKTVQVLQPDVLLAPGTQAAMHESLCLSEARPLAVSNGS